jgi:hypothetical protein
MGSKDPVAKPLEPMIKELASPTNYPFYNLDIVVHDILDWVWAQA